MGQLAMWLCGAGLVIMLVCVVAVLSANVLASRDDRILDRTKTFKRLFSESRPKDDDRKD